MEQKLLIIGAGSFATELEELARLCGYNEIAFLDDFPDGARCKPVIGHMDDIPEMRKKYNCAIVTLGNNKKRMEYMEILQEHNFEILVLIPPTAYVSPNAIIENGGIIRAKAVASRYMVLKNFV